MKKLLSLLLIAAMATGLFAGTAIAAEPDISLQVDGQAVALDASLGDPFVQNGNTMMPLRAVAYALGMTEQDVAWDGAAKTATFQKGDTAVTFTVGSNVCTIRANGETTTRQMDATLVNTDGRVYAPVRYLAEALGYNVGWDGDSQTAMLVSNAGIVSVTGGQIAGTTSEDGEVAIYKGIPYAAPPVGELRWKAPADVVGWDGVRSCDAFGPCAVQNWPDFSQPWMACYTQEFMVNQNTDTLSEDCLYLNVWTQNDSADEKKPVIVYFHGGGYGEGSGSIEAYGGEGIAKAGAVYVNVNYRLGIFGFLTTPELDAESPTGTSGNYGLLDSVKALEWVQENIAQFGGDPDNVTIVGQSAGGMTIDYMIQSPLAEGLFQNAVVLSGNYIRAGRSSETTSKASIQEAFAEAYPDVTLAELRAMSTEEVYQNYQISGKACIDGYVVPEDVTDTMAAGTQNKVNVLQCCVEGDIFDYFMPTVISTVEEYETWLDENFGDWADDVLALYPAATDEEASAQYEAVSVDRQMGTYFAYLNLNENAGRNGFQAYFTHTMPGPSDCGAFHTADVPYWLDSLDTPNARKELTELDFNMAETMSKYLVNFAKTGNPNGDGLTAWTEYDGQTQSYMEIGDNTFEMTTVDAEKAEFWQDYINETSLGGALQ